VLLIFAPKRLYQINNTSMHIFWRIWMQFS